MARTKATQFRLAPDTLTQLDTVAARYGLTGRADAIRWLASREAAKSAAWHAVFCAAPDGDGRICVGFFPTREYAEREREFGVAIPCDPGHYFHAEAVAKGALLYLRACDVAYPEVAAQLYRADVRSMEQEDKT